METDMISTRVASIASRPDAIVSSWTILDLRRHLCSISVCRSVLTFLVIGAGDLLDGQRRGRGFRASVAPLRSRDCKLAVSDHHFEHLFRKEGRYFAQWEGLTQNQIL